MDDEEFSEEARQQFAMASQQAADSLRDLAVAAARLSSVATVVRITAHERRSLQRPDLYAAPAEVAEAALARAAKR